MRSANASIVRPRASMLRLTIIPGCMERNPGESPAMVVLHLHPHGLGCPNNLRPVLKVHGVVVVPLAAPNEAVLLEDLDDLPGHSVPVRVAAVGGRLGPEPVVAARGGDVDGDAGAVRGDALGAGHDAAV